MLAQWPCQQTHQHHAKACCRKEQAHLHIACGQPHFREEHELRIRCVTYKVDHRHHDRDIAQHRMAQHITQSFHNICANAGTYTRLTCLHIETAADEDE